MAIRSPSIYGLMAEFEDPNALVAAAYRAHYEGYRAMDAYSPFPIEELHEALGVRTPRLPLIVLIGGIVGALGGYVLQYWATTIAYPLNVAGKPFNSWPMFIPVTFECTILGRGAVGRVRHAGAERPAAAVSPGVQRAALRAGQPQPLLPVHRGSEIRSSTSRRRGASSKHSGLVEVTTVARLGQRRSRAGAAAAADRARLGVACRQDMHDQPKYSAARAVDVLRRRQLGAAAVAGTVARGQLEDDRAALHREGQRRGCRRLFPFPVDRGRDGARTGAVQHLLFAVPRPDRRRRRHGRPARVHARRRRSMLRASARRRWAISST